MKDGAGKGGGREKVKERNRKRTKPVIKPTTSV